ncbi:hypothetical protein ACJIZ3_014262 [Penstemon smallii]|uniref:non-specific serine/threonine protein kinase n=1 Tax=Penstemon smallii TaxID=265156 RepID=A0ABD3RJ15_9LAMI
MHKFLVSAALFFTFTVLPFPVTSDIYVNCGSTGTSTAVDGREWVGDDNYPNFAMKGSSTKSTVTEHVDPVPYNTARISRSQFSYIFQVSPGQKFIRLHFNPTSSYHGFKRLNDLFTVEAGPFTLLSNFSASITADALSLNSFSKEFCLSVEEKQPLTISFFSHSQDRHAFVNGIEIISVPNSISYCQNGDVGVQVVGQKSLVYIDNNTALELVDQRSVKRDYSISPGDGFRGMFGMWGTVSKEKANRAKNFTWRVSVDVGFRYLVRLHFCETAAENGQKNFVVLINHIIVNTNGSGPVYRNFVVMETGRKREGKRKILISLQSEDEFVYGHGPLEGFEIFKLSNHDNSLASPNPLPPTRDSPYWSIQNSLPVLGCKNKIATVVITMLCLLDIIVYMLQKNLDASFSEEQTKPSIKATRLCRCFSLAEIRLATKDFNDAVVIGKGGFGKVYKGCIGNGQEIVAIKRLKSNSKQGKREFWTEIESLSELRHVNLVSLIGYCNEHGEMIIVYEYMPNGTLADHLYRLARKNQKYSFLSWEERLNICIGAGRGIDYLHTGHGVIHRDIKSSNILLDECFVAKVSDFGLAKTHNLRDLRSHVSTNFKGTFGYFDPEYFRTHTLTRKSDTYSFGVVLLEVLCGRPAVDPLVEEDKHSLTMWARDKISRGEVDQIVAPSLRGKISPDSLKAFVGIVERCLHNEPKKRPTLANVVTHLELILEQQNTKSLVLNEIASVADVLSCTDKTQQDNTKSLVPNEITNVADRTILSVSTGQLEMASSRVQSVNGGMVNAEPPYGKEDRSKTISHMLLRIWKKAKPSKKKDSIGISISAPISHHTSNKKSSRGNTVSQNVRELLGVGGSNELISNPNFRIFSFSELKAATRNFSPDSLLGQGGFGGVYKGFLKENSTDEYENGSVIAVKRLSLESMQGFKEWLTEVNFLGNLRHPNLVKLLGYCSENNELLLIYEFMPNGTLHTHLFRRGSIVLPWDTRTRILIGAASGLAYLHDLGIIFRDFKPSNILLDGSYRAKLSDFGLAKTGPSGDNTHVSTSVVGTYGYAAPEFILTGRLYVKSDVYSFGVVIIEMLTGLRALDKSRPSTQQDLVNWIKSRLSDESKLMKILDPRLEGTPKSLLLQMFQLAGNCLKIEPRARPSMQEVFEILKICGGAPPRVRGTDAPLRGRLLWY